MLANVGFRRLPHRRRFVLPRSANGYSVLGRLPDQWHLAVRLMSRAIRMISLFIRGKSSSAAVVRNLGIRIGLLAINFGTGVIVARSLGPAGRGEQAAIALWPAFIATLATLGMPTALNFHSRRSPDDAKRFYMGSAILMLIVGLTASAVGAAAMPFLLHGYDAQTIRVAQWLMLFAPETLVASAARAHLESQNQFTRSTLGFLYPNVATLVALCVLRVTGHLTPITAALSYIVPPAIQAVWLVSRLWQHNVFRLDRFTRDICLLLPYGLKCYGLDIVNAVSGQMDLVVIVAFLSPAELGLYTVALSLCRVLNVVHTSVVTILFSRATSLATDEAIELVTRAARLSTVLCMCFGILLLLVVHLAIPVVYGTAFIAAIPLLALLTIEAVLSGLVVVLFQAFMATGRPAVVTIVQACWTVAAIGLLVLLVPRMNVAGAATALVAAAVLRFGLVMAAFPVILRRSVPNLILNAADITYIRSRISRIGFERRPVATDKTARSAS